MYSLDLLPPVNEWLAFVNALCNDTHVCICLDFTPFILILHPSIFSLIETPFGSFYIFTHIEKPLGSIWLEKWKSGRIKNWEDKKLGEDRKMGGYKRFSFFLFLFGWENGKVERMKIYLFG